MNKKYVSLALVGTMAATMLTGCGKSKSDSNSGSNGNVEISFYTTETGKDDMFQNLISDFEDKNPGITVEYIAAGNDQLQQWMSLYSSNEGPTVSLMDPINIYENRERMYELTNESFIGNIEESALSTMTFDSKVYAAPMTAAGVGILYNKEVCDKAVGGDFDPSSIKTRDDLEKLFEQIEATGVAATCLTGINWSLGAHYLCQTYGAANGTTQERVDYVNSIIDGELNQIDSEVFNGYMDTFDLLAKYNLNKADPLVGDVNLDAVALVEGRCGTWFMGDWAWTYFSDMVTEGQEFGLLPIPYSNDENDKINQSIPTSYAKGYCVDASQNNEEQQKAGVKFIEYLTSDKDAHEMTAKVCGQALPYKNADIKIESPLGLSTAKYISNGLTYDFYGTANLCPADIWYDCGATMCEYLAGASDRQKLASQIDAYWRNQEKR